MVDLAFIREVLGNAGGLCENVLIADEDCLEQLKENAQALKVQIVEAINRLDAYESN